MNRLPVERRAQILSLLVEGNSLRSTCRLAAVSINTVTKLLVDVGAACSDYQDRVLANLPCKRIQADEIWSFCYSKQRNVPEDKRGEFGYGDVWTWTAIDANTKLCVSWLVGNREADTALDFMDDVASRLLHRVQLTTDGNKSYLTAVEEAFGSDIDYALLQKTYGKNPKEEETRYSPAVCTGIKLNVIRGDPDPAHINTSYVERQNLTMRMGMRRFTRLTNAFSKKVENHAAAVALHFMHYNFARPHMALKNPYPRTPAIAVGVADHIWTMTEIARLSI